MKIKSKKDEDSDPECGDPELGYTRANISYLHNGRTLVSLCSSFILSLSYFNLEKVGV